MLDERTIKLECLRLVNSPNKQVQQIIEEARELYNFIDSKAKISEPAISSPTSEILELPETLEIMETQDNL